jgi:hypothetical protein
MGHQRIPMQGSLCVAVLPCVDGRGLPLPILSLKGSPETHLITPPASCLSQQM